MPVVSERRAPAALAPAQRAELLMQLAELEEAGVPADRAYAIIGSGADSRVAHRASAVASALGRGRPLALSAERAGLLTPLEAQLVGAATQVGSPAGVYRRLGARAEQEARNRSRVRPQIYMPAAVLLVALLVAPLPALVGGRTTVGAYLLGRLQVIVSLGLLAYLLSVLGHRAASGAPGLGLARLELSLPVLGAQRVRDQAGTYLWALGTLLEAGLPAFDALPRATATVGNMALRLELERVQTALLGGSSLGDALGESPRLQSLSGYALVGSGEEAGRTPEMLLRWAARLDDQASERPELSRIGLIRIALARIRY